MNSRRAQPEPNWDLVWKRNSIERLKREKPPWAILQELPDLARRGYEEIPEEDIVRLQWYGLYHDKPKIGYFMMRIKIPGGILTPQKLRVIGHLSARFGRNYGELTTRQNIQLHWIQLPHLAEIFQALEEAGLTTQGGCGDTVRNITGCPVSGLDPAELFDARPVIEEAARFFYGNPAYSNLPRKHKITISACPSQCNAPDIHCIALVGALKDGRPGFAVRIGGGLSTAPRLARDLGVFIEIDEALEVLRAIIDIWQEAPKYRLSRVKARLKFMVDDVGPERYRQLIEERIGRRLEDFVAPTPTGRTEHIGVHPQRQAGLYYVGFPVSCGLMSGEQMLRIADLVESYGGDIRLTRYQNFILTGIPEARLDEVIQRVREIGFPLEANRIRASSIACTGQPLCNYAVAETKTKLAQIIEHLEATFGRQIEGLQIALDGCPHACAHHWVGDIGLQGTTLRQRGDGAQEKIEAYEIYLRGGLGREAAIGRPILRRVPSDQVHRYVERLIRAYLTDRRGDESIQSFFSRHTDEALIAIAQGEPMPSAG